MPPRQQCIWLRKSTTWATSPGSRERTLGCRPSPNRSPPRRSGWPRASAGYAVTKGNRTRATTWRPEVRQEFSPFLLKRAPCGESSTKGEGSVCETHQPSCRLRATGLPLPTHACRRRLLPVHERRGLRANEDEGWLQNNARMRATGHLLTGATRGASHWRLLRARPAER
jgi:hypothetical protein